MCCEHRRERGAKHVSVHTRLSNTCAFSYDGFVWSRDPEYFLKKGWIKRLLGGEAPFLAACKG